MATALAALIFLGIPLALLLILKANGGIMFFAACAGIVLLSSLDTVFVATAGSVVPGEGESTVRLLVVMATIVFSALAFRGSVRGLGVISNGVVVLLLAALLWVELPPVVGASWLIETMQQRSWQIANNFHTVITAAGLGLSLLVVMTKNHRPKKSKKH